MNVSSEMRPRRCMRRERPRYVGNAGAWAIIKIGRQATRAGCPKFSQKISEWKWIGAGFRSNVGVGGYGPTVKYNADLAEDG